VEPTNLCNLKCHLCFQSNNSMKRKKGMMSTELYKKIIKEIIPLNATVVLHLAGEPFLHPDLFKFIRYAKSSGLNVRLSTNGTLIQKNSFGILDTGIDRIEVSIMGINKEDYKRTRNIDGFDRLKKNIQSLTSEKCRKNVDMEILLSAIKTQNNINDIDTFITSFSSIDGINRVFVKGLQNWTGTVDITSVKQTNPSKLPIQLIDALRVLRQYLYNQIARTEDLIHPICTNPFYRIAICWDGTVVPCCLDIDQKFPLGNIKDNSLMSIWKGEKLDGLRKTLRSRRLTLKHPLCGKCKGEN